MCVCFCSSVVVISPSLAFSIISKLHNLCTQGIYDVFEIGRELSQAELSLAGSSTSVFTHKEQSPLLYRSRF